MKISQATLPALLGLVAVFNSFTYAQSGGGASGGGGGTAGGGVAGATGGAGVSVPGSGTGGSVAGGTAFGPAGAFGGAGNVGFGAQSPGFNRGGPIPGNAVGLQRQRAFAQGLPFNQRQQFNQPQQFNQFNRNPFIQNQQRTNAQQNRILRSEQFLDRQDGFVDQTGDGAFGGASENNFTQGMTNQGAFGLGNGNRSSFFDNQPFNDQGFGQGAGAGASANSSTGFTAANDPGGFTGTDSTFDDTGDIADDADDGDPRFRGQPAGVDVSSSTASSEFGTTSDAENETGAGTGPNSSRGVTAAGDPPGFTGTPSTFSRSTPLGTGTPADSGIRGTSPTGPATTSRGSAGGAFSQDGSFSGEDANSSRSAFNNFRASSAVTPGNGDATNFDDNSARPVERSQSSVVRPFNTDVNRSRTFDGTPSGNQADIFFPTEDGVFDNTHDPVVPAGSANGSQNRSGAFEGASSGNTSEFFFPRDDDAFDDAHDPVFPANGANSSQGGARGGRFVPGGNGFMNQNSRGQNLGPFPGGQAGASSASRQPGVANPALRARLNAGPPQGQGPQQNSPQGEEPPNNFNGSFSRARL